MRVAIVQVCSSDDLDRNLAHAEAGIREAAERGAHFVALPENFAYMRREGGRFPCVQGPDGEIVRALRGWAAQNAVWLLGGTFPEAIPGAAADDARVHNTSILVAPDGREVARYRKIHLFDVRLGPRPEDAYRESTWFAPGDAVVVAPTDFGPVGLSICYDLRFPELYRALVDRGARWLVVPSAFTPETGKDHWEVLLRARAIESQCYVIAPAQCGRHAPDRASHGRSLVIDPWGLVLAQAGDEPKVLVADCPTEAVDRVRERVPALTHRRLPAS
ncbi:MAG: carbon-nitrogen hydrolase family protein [Spirochaetaceae bacterium]|nr:carbon-nitrogen hydrolase family protein [Myxococcales bacterium]MCB9725265.1 carbon-nitrogen hydrolase family protein [Spirochaetaceae bacterium]HPG26524.1 carbon-nitrogen hydrolase family protein [Myxococcota bacterium]